MNRHVAKIGEVGADAVGKSAHTQRNTLLVRQDNIPMLGRKRETEKPRGFAKP